MRRIIRSPFTQPLPLLAPFSFVLQCRLAISFWYSLHSPRVPSHRERAHRSLPAPDRFQTMAFTVREDHPRGRSDDKWFFAGHAIFLHQEGVGKRPSLCTLLPLYVSTVIPNSVSSVYIAFPHTSTIPFTSQVESSDLVAFFNAITHCRQRCSISLPRKIIIL